MDKSLVCRVLVPKKGKDKLSVSTGIAVKKGVVLMSKHALDDWDKSKSVCFQWDINNHGLEKNLSFESKSDKTLFIGETNDQFDIDVALISTDTPPSTPLRAWMLTNTKHKGTPGCEVYGYPKKGAKNTHYPATSFLADLCSANQNGKLELDSKTNINPPQGWKGISGAPIYTGTILRGIVIELQKAHEKRLEGITLDKLLREDKIFSEALGFSQSDEENTNNFAASIGLLKTKDKKLLKLINDSLKSTKDISFETAEELCNYLVAIPITELLKLLSEVQSPYHKSNSGIGTEIGKLTSALLPSFADSGSASHIEQSIGDSTAPIIVIPYVIPISAEMLMAKVDKRPLEIQSYTKDQFIAKFGLIMPPESGEDIEQQVKDITDDYYQYFGGDKRQQLIAKKVTHHLFDELIAKSDLPDEGVSEKEKIAFVQDEFEYRREEGKPTHYVILKPNHFGGEEGMQVFASMLKETYPQYAVLSFSSSKQLLREERKQVRKIRSTLSLS